MALIEKNERSFMGMAIIKYIDKIEKKFLAAVFLLSTVYSCTPKLTEIPKNEFGLQVIDKNRFYKQSIKTDSSHRMVALDKVLNPTITAFYYATTNNFTKQVLYKNPKAYLRLEAANAIKKVQDTLFTLGYDIKIFDSYRPYTVTKKMWEIVPDDRYAANPANGSGHNRGVAIDLTLIEIRTGNEVAMPTPYDSFSDTAHHDFMQLPKNILQNRALLKNTMEQYGFVALDTEWWHYYLPQPKRYELLDLSFKQMKRLTK
jgi:zinc D-Ala-D-Ala dipeptidase